MIMFTADISIILEDVWWLIFRTPFSPIEDDLCLNQILVKKLFKTLHRCQFFVEIFFLKLLYWHKHNIYIDTVCMEWIVISQCVYNKLRFVYMKWIIFFCKKRHSLSPVKYLFSIKTKLRGLSLWASYTDRATATVPYGHNLSILDQSRYFFVQVAPQLYSQGWVDPVPDPLLIRKSGSTGNGTQISGSVEY
jgi:hypothetical protein